MAESLPDDDDLDDIETDDDGLDDGDGDGDEPVAGELGDDGEPDDGDGSDDGGAEDGEPEDGDADDDDSDPDDDGDDDSLSETALLAATMPLGMAGRKQQPQAAVPGHPGGKPEAAPHQPAPGGKQPAGHPAGQAPSGQHPASGHPAAPHQQPGQHAPNHPSGKGEHNGKGKGGKGGDGAKALTAALKELDTAQKAHDALEKPHDTATKKLVDSAKTSATGLKPMTDALKKSTTEHKNAKKEHDDHEKLQDELDKALTGGGLGFVMKLIDQLKPAIDKISDILGKLKNALVKAFEKALKPVADFFERVWSKVAVPAFQKTAQVLSGAFNAVGNVLRPVFESLKRVCATVVRAVGEVLKDLDFTVPSWVPLVGGTNLGLSKVGDTLIEWSTKMRNGGLVRGPGGPREDKVPVMMSNGEFVINAASTAKHLHLLRAINNEASGIRSTLESGYAATAKSLPGTTGAEARALARSDRPQLVIAKRLGPTGDHLDRSLKVNISAPEIDHAYHRDAAAVSRKSLTYSAGRR